MSIPIMKLVCIWYHGLCVRVKVRFHKVRKSVCVSASVIHTFSLSILFYIIVYISPDPYTDPHPRPHPGNGIALGSDFLRTYGLHGLENPRN